MAVEWSNAKIMQLIELFQSKSLLWDPSLKEYKDINKKNDAFEEISQALNIPKKDVETKIHILRTQFSREKKKLSAKKTTGSGAIEKCKWIYYEPLEFLLCGATTSCVKDTMNKTVDENNAFERDMELASPPSQSPRPSSNATTSSSSRKRNKTGELSEIFEVMKSAKKKMDEKEKKDPYDIYGEYVAAELRSVKDDQAVTRAKHHINNILYELKMGRYNIYGYQTASYHPSSTPNNVQETEIREIERQETNILDAKQDKTEDSAILNLVINTGSFLGLKST